MKSYLLVNEVGSNIYLMKYKDNNKLNSKEKNVNKLSIC